MSGRFALVVLLLLAGAPVGASQTLCTFEGGEGRRYYEVEFFGDGEAAPVVAFSATAFDGGRRVTLPAPHYALRRFDREDASLALDFRNPGDPALPPSFTLTATHGRAEFRSGAAIVVGTLACSR